MEGAESRSVLVRDLFSTEIDCESKGDVTRDDSQRRFLAQHSAAMLLRYCFELFQHCNPVLR